MRMNTEAIAKRLVELCREGKYEDAQRELYAKDAVSIEPDGLPPGALGSVRGLAAIYEKGRQFNALIEAVHGGSVSEPAVAGNWFSVAMAMDVTMKGRGRMNMSEICVYRVRDGKIVHEQFFYDVG
jgi:ketosteroid isomerase-like protein